LIPQIGVLLVGQLGPLLEQTGWVARFVLVLLLGFSLFSWAVIFQKSRMFSLLERHTGRFLAEFRSRRKLNDPKPMTPSASPLVAVYTAGVREVESQLAETNPHAGRVRSQNAILATMQGASSNEVRKLEKWMPFLATTGSVTPFIGLFGTVWGIIDAFSGLGEAGARTTTSCIRSKIRRRRWIRSRMSFWRRWRRRMRGSDPWRVASGERREKEGVLAKAQRGEAR
jgi:biopolymer transport protein TolQ